MNHDTAVEIYVRGGVGHHFPDKAILHAQDVVGVGQVGVEVTELAVEFVVFAVVDFEDTVFDEEGISVVFTEWMLGEFRGPTVEVLAVEERNPGTFRRLGFGRGGSRD